LYLLLLMVVNMYKHMGKVVIKILKGSVVTQTVLGGGANYISSGCKFPIVYMCQNYGNWLTVDKVIAKIIWLTFFGPPCIQYIFLSMFYCSLFLVILFCFNFIFLPIFNRPVPDLKTWRNANQFDSACRAAFM